MAFDIYTKRHKGNEIPQDLNRLSTTITMENATKDAQMETQEELPANRKQLFALIQKESAKSSKTLKDNIQALRSQLNG